MYNISPYNHVSYHLLSCKISPPFSSHDSNNNYIIIVKPLGNVGFIFNIIISREHSNNPPNRGKKNMHGKRPQSRGKNN